MTGTILDKIRKAVKDILKIIGIMVLGGGNWQRITCIGSPYTCKRG